MIIKKKVCLLGAFGVGKTSLVSRFVESRFSEVYVSTVGVKVHRKIVAVGEEEVMMMIWDVAGEEEFYQIPESYVRGASGIIFVADGTRPETLTTLKMIHERVIKLLGADLPSVILLLNKCDLDSDWRVSEEEQIALGSTGIPCLLSSAKTGEGVEKGFALMAEQLVASSANQI